MSGHWVIALQILGIICTLLGFCVGGASIFDQRSGASFRFKAGLACLIIGGAICIAVAIGMRLPS